MSIGDGRIILTRRDNRILFLLIKDNRLLKAGVREETFPVVGDIFIGKVKNIAGNIGAAFVEIEKGLTCYLALDKVAGPLILNRPYEGKLQIGDEIAVQVEKEALKTKDAVVTTDLSFSGKYAVVTTGRTQTGYSHKLKEGVKKQIGGFLEERGLLELSAEGMPLGLVVRTNAGELTDYTFLEEEIRMLLAEASELLRVYRYRTCYTCLKSAPAPYLNDIRDTYMEDYSRIVTDDEEIYAMTEEYLRKNQPGELDRLVFYRDDSLSLSSLYGLESKLKEALSPRVWLKSGGYLIIEPTEALTVIDVNTGKFTGKRKAQETFFMINKEACEEIAIQLALRNISGIIIIDFINMESQERRKDLLAWLRCLLRRDSIRTEVIDMTPLGLVELTRKKVNKSLAEQIGTDYQWRKGHGI